MKKLAFLLTNLLLVLSLVSCSSSSEGGYEDGYEGDSDIIEYPNINSSSSQTNNNSSYDDNGYVPGDSSTTEDNSFLGNVAINNLELSGHNLTWQIDSIFDNVNVSYTVSYGTNTYDVNSKSYYVNNIEETGTYTFKVTALDDPNGRYTGSSAEIRKDIKVMNAPYHLRMDQSGLISWDISDTTSEVCVIVNGQESSTQITPVSGEKYNVIIYTKGDGDLVYESKKIEKEFEFLNLPLDVKFENGVLSWSRVEGAQGYQVIDNGQPVKSTIQSIYKPKKINESHVFSVVALGNGTTIFDSEPSNSVSVLY